MARCELSDHALLALLDEDAPFGVLTTTGLALSDRAGSVMFSARGAMDEDYYLACIKANLSHPAIERLCALLAAPAWTHCLATLPGYTPADDAGGILKMTAVLPWWRYTRPKVRPTRRSAHRALSPK
jgi:hypothetical protein